MASFATFSKHDEERFVPIASDFELNNNQDGRQLIYGEP